MTPIEPLQPHEAVTDSAGDVFDPELHAAKPNGEPAVKTDGTFRKKRRDAGGRRAAGATRTTTRTTRTSSSSGVPKALAEQHARHVKGVQNMAAGLLLPLSFVSPVDAFTLSDHVPMLAEALADYAPENPQVAATLDKLSAGGGLFTVLSVVSVMALQVTHNHGVIPEHMARMVGVKPLSETRKLMQQRADAMEREAEAQRAYDEETRRMAAQYDAA